MSKLRRKIIMKVFIIASFILSTLSYIRLSQTKSTQDLISLLFTSFLVLIGLYVNHKGQHLRSGKGSSDDFVVFDEDERSLAIDKQARLIVSKISFATTILCFFILSLVQIETLTTITIFLVWGLIEIAKELGYYLMIVKLYKQ
jgi:hypothetical protein